MLNEYNPRHWYWGPYTDGRFYASAQQDFVDADDEGLAEWRARGFAPTLWPRDESGAQTTAALQDVLTPHGIFVDLAAYTADKRWRLETGGITVGGAPVRTDRESQAMINGAFALAKDSPSTSILFKTAAGFASLNADAIVGIGRAVAAHVQACFAAEADVLYRINAGDISTKEQIDAAFAALLAG